MNWAITEPSGEPRDEGDRAADLADMDRAIALRAHQAAMQADATGGPQMDTEGRARCRDCGAVIPPARLAARPGACLCLECQTARELSSRLGGVRR